MRSQPAVRFYEPPVTEYNSMDVDDSTESRISLGMLCFQYSSQLTGDGPDALDDVYLGPDDETESRISSGMCCFEYILQLTGHLLDPSEDVYLGPDDEIDYDSGSSGVPDVLDAVSGRFLTSPLDSPTVDVHSIHPDHLCPAQPEELPLFNDPDLYLGPDDDLIDCDEAPECADVETDAPAIPGIAIPGEFTHTISFLLLM
jgi:hypothetical protein